jgi:hypothetical protein
MLDDMQTRGGIRVDMSRDSMLHTCFMHAFTASIAPLPVWRGGIREAPSAIECVSAECNPHALINAEE